MTATETPRPTNCRSTPKQPASVGAQNSPGATNHSAPNPSTPRGGPDLFLDATESVVEMLGLLAANVDDLEGTRIAVLNRLAQARRNELDADGQMRGFGLDDRNPYVRQTAVVLAALEEAERAAILSLQRAMRKHPLGPWVKSQRGLGEKQVARLLGKIGDPYMRPPLVSLDGDGNEVVEPAGPRRVSQLWRYCGLHVLPARRDCLDAHTLNAGGNQTGHPDQSFLDTHSKAVGVAPKRERGKQSDWNEEARKRVFLIATSVVKQLDKTCAVDPEVKAARHVEGCACSPFRKVYDQTRLKYADAVHRAECVRCGPSGSPAPVGSPLSDAHKHARALRQVGKKVLMELWREAGRLHGADTAPPE